MPYSEPQKLGQATLEEIHTFVKSSGIAKVDLKPDDIMVVLNTLMYDGLVDVVGDENEEYDVYT